VSEIARESLRARVAALTPAERQRLAARLRQGVRRDERPTSGETGVDRPLGLDQERMWRLEQATPSGAANLVAAATRMRGPLDRPALEQSLRHVVGRHDSLRTTFGTVGGEPVQLVADDVEADVAFHDLTDVSPAERRRRVRELLTSLARQPFSFERPLFRVAALKLADDHHVLAVVLHHIVTDWVSYATTMRELFAAYEAFACGVTPSLPPVSMQYGEWVAREREWLATERAAVSLEFWRRELESLPDEPSFPLDRPRPAASRFRGERQWLILPERVHAGLRSLSRREHATLFMPILAALDALVLGTGAEEAVVGAPTANRSLGPDDLTGLLLSVMVLRARAAGSTTFSSFLRDVRARTLEALSHADVPFAEIVRRTRPDRWLAYTPLFKVRYLFLEEPYVTRAGGLILTPVDIDPRASLYDTTVTIWEGRGRLYGRFEFDPDLFNRRTVADLAGRLGAILAAVADDPERPLAELGEDEPIAVTVGDDEIDELLERTAGASR
jgi:hypothetical protein